MSVFNNMSILFLLFFFLIVFEKCKFLLVKKGFYFVFKYFLKIFGLFDVIFRRVVLDVSRVVAY